MILPKNEVKRLFILKKECLDQVLPVWAKQTESTYFFKLEIFWSTSSLPSGFNSNKAR